MARVLIVDDAPLTIANVERLLAGQDDLEFCGSAHDGDTALEMVRELHPDIVLMDMDLQRGDGLRTAQAITAQVPDVAVVVMGLEEDDDTLQRVSDAGARDYLVKPFGADELLTSLREVMAGRTQVESGLGASNMGDFATEAPPLFRPVEPVTVAIPAANPDKQVIVVVSGKGGVGTTVLATNLALLAANEAHRRVAIIDFDLQHGDVRRMLRVEAREGIVEVAKASPSAERQALIPRLVDCQAGVMALLPPAIPAIDTAISPEFLTALLLQMRAIVDIVIVDLPTHITHAGVAALRAADRVVLVSSMSDPGVRATQGMLRLIASLGVSPEKVVVALNRNEANSDLTKSSVEEALGRMVPVQLPYDPILVSTSINRGAPFVLQKPDAQVSRKVRELASLLFPMPLHFAPSDEPQGSSQRGKTHITSEEPGARRKTKKKGLFSLISKD